MHAANQNEALLCFRPLKPETQRAVHAWLDFQRIKNPFSEEDRQYSASLKARADALQAIDPAALLDRADELERWAAKKDEELVQFPTWEAYAISAAAFRKTAEELRAQAARLSMAVAA